MTDVDTWNNVRYRDPYTFQKAEDFFSDFDAPAQSWVKQPTSISYTKQDNYDKNKLLDVCYRGRIFRFDTGGLLLIQFLRPRVWRIRFNEKHIDSSFFTDYNTRTIVRKQGKSLIQELDHAEDLDWDLELEGDGDSSNHLLLMSVVKKKAPNHPQGYVKQIGVKLWIQKEPFRITATRSVGASPAFFAMPDDSAHSAAWTPPTEEVEAVIWQTKERGFQYGNGAVVLSVERTPTARYMGFGEQGGTKFIKDQTFMNYFNFDNMRYYNIYNRGPKCEAEPLYHSDPYFIEVNANPSLQSQVATFIDNYSQVCMDVGRLDWLSIRLATRFNAFAGLFFAGDNVQDIITLFTSIIGRPRLKPRYVLGYHQGCYGYDTRSKVENIVDKYRHYQYPMDGMHIDVDMQDNYRTFTINLNTFPDPPSMFKKLRNQGVKCSTNITPVIANVPCDWYNTLNEGLKKGYFVMDERDMDPSVADSDHIRYVQYGKGNKYTTNPSNVDTRATFNFGRDNYNFRESFNNKLVPFHGGVDYGGGKGSPGHYPNLNNKAVRHWWGEQYQNLFDNGLEFVWQDMTSPCMGQNYGDMKSWPFRLMLEADGWSGDPSMKGANGEMMKKKAIEIWSLYSYNLHKATYHGLNRMETRKGKRNFIIGRGSFTGAHRFAGLWTGDNSSTWDFFNISVAQVLSLGLSGVTVAGADVGGFEPPESGEQFCDPELFIRWNLAYSLLPWYRNHYVQKGKKMFQEPWAYEEFTQSQAWRDMNMPAGDWALYRAVHPIVRYYIRLRYSLMQLMYDTMFENLLHGLPIARAMIVTDPLDGSLFAANENYTRSQYLVGNDLLHAPCMYERNKRDRRKLYLPAPSAWYQFNLRAFDNDNSLGVPLQGRVAGGKHVHYTASIKACWHQDEDRLIPEALPYVTPMYVREGCIIPQIPVLDFVPDRNDPEQAKIQTPITLNIYPGRVLGARELKDSPYCYDMYLDDGVSRDSAPEDAYLAGSDEIGHTNPDRRDRLRGAFGDHDARSKFTHVRVIQTVKRVGKGSGSATKFERQLTIKSTWDKYPYVERDIGKTFRVVFWHEPGARIDYNNLATVKDAAVVDKTYFDDQAKATVLRVPLQGKGEQKSLTITVPYEQEE
ncbi:glycosyl hydrolases family 31 protein [Elsinoe australis]|uniref:alpha-glucosidase n=1 Tax=Elsinoe australis TaxID=40998 RepID=A0A4U7AP49_9PEZI|nr:glycosyl hydrolases family 31 protein [Elsinoe australis]